MLNVIEILTYFRTRTRRNEYIYWYNNLEGCDTDLNKRNAFLNMLYLI